MTDKLEQAKQEVEESYNYLVESVRDVTTQYTAEVDGIVKELSKGINLFSNSELWDFQMRLGIAAFVLGNVKEQSMLKEACAEALYKEGLAKSFIAADGTQEAKRQSSVIETIDKQAVSLLYASVSSLLKTKCDEAHRLVSIIQNIQISRAAEAKISASPRSENDRVLLENI